MTLILFCVWNNHKPHCQWEGRRHHMRVVPDAVSPVIGLTPEDLRCR